MELITGVASVPHVTSTQHRSIFETLFGSGSYILDKGGHLEPELESNNSIRINSGMLCHHGGISEIPLNAYDEVTISNGAQGVKRIDLIVARYERNPETQIETMTWRVIQGDPAETGPITPEHVVGNMQNGDLVDECPAYKVHIDGIQVTSIEKLLPILNTSVSSLNSKVTSLETFRTNLKKTTAGCFRIPDAGFMFEWGTVGGISVPESGIVTKNVTFSTAFKAAPIVWCEELGNYNIKANPAANGSASGFTMNIRSIDGYARTDRSVNWFAIGYK